MTRHFIIGTAGHIDHGKSTLVEALTGVDPDRLPEEKARGMTIELGFAHAILEDSTAPDTQYSLGIVDVPGHADFVRNMLAGVSAIDLALFIVASDDGWMPQSEEHLQILQYLGVKRAVVALTKADLLEEEDYLREEIADRLAGSQFAGSQVVPVCALDGKGIPELKAAIAETLREVPDAEDAGKPRLPIDRAFSPKGVGTVVTGTLTGGTLAKGQSVVVQPGGRSCQIRHVQNHAAEVAEALPATRTAMNLSDVSVAVRGKDGVGRGDVVTLESMGEATHLLEVLVDKGNREVLGQRAALNPLPNGQRIRVHVGSGNYSARVFFYETRELEAGGKALAQLRMEEPVFALIGDHFVLRDWGKRMTLAGGRVLDVKGTSGRKFRNPTQIDFLQKRADEFSEKSLILSELEKDHAVRKSGLLTNSIFSKAGIEGALEALVAAEELSVSGDWIFGSAWWNEVRQVAANLVDAEHREHPELTGLSLGPIRAALEARLPHKRLFEPLIEALCSDEFARVGNLVKRKDHQPILPDALKSSGEAVKKALAENPFEPPNPGEIASTKELEKALKFLIDSGQAKQVDPKVVLLTDAYDRMIQAVRDYLEANGEATISDLRQTLGTTRRVLMPILDIMDSEGITVRKGDVRVLKET